MDGQALDLADGTVDIAGSQFGVMLFPDMPRGIRELARVTKPGGRVLMTAYGDPERDRVPRVLRGAPSARSRPTSGPPLDPPPLPFQLRDPERLRFRAERRPGCGHVQVETFTERTEFGSAVSGAAGSGSSGSNPVAGEVLAELGLS